MTDISQYKQSHEPIFWGLFGFGGTVITFAMPALLVALLVAGLTDGVQGFHLTQVISHWWGAGALVLIILGISFHCVHRIYFSLRDLRISVGVGTQIIFYGLASLMTLVSAGAVLKYYISTF